MIAGLSIQKKDFGKFWKSLNKEEIKILLLNEFKSFKFQNLTKPVYAAGHRWLYGFGEKALGLDYIYDPNLKIGICGDWCRGNTVLDAAISGASLAEKIISFDIE